jgi:molecular chaperone DnaK
MHERARAEQLVAEARQVVQEQSGLERVRPLIADLQQLVHGLPSSAAAQPAGVGAGTGSGDGPGAGPGAGQGAGTGDDEVIDAEFTRE